MTLNSDTRSNGAAYEGWLYHVGVNSLGYQFCHPRYLSIKGKYVEMYKRNPHDHPRKPIRSGIVGQYFMTEELGRQIYHGRALYVLRIYSRVDYNKQGKLACSNAEEVEKWIDAFHHAKEEAEYHLEKASSRRLKNNEQEFKLSGSRYYNSRSYLRVPRHSITIGKGPESLLRRPSMVAQDPDDADDYYKRQEGDALEQEDWRCILTVNGLRIFEDISSPKLTKGAIFMKSVGVVEATPDMIFDMIMTLDRTQRHQWDILTGDLELVEDIDGHSDIVHGVYDPRLHKRWCRKCDFLFLRRWRRDQDGSYSITEDSATHKRYPQRLGYHRVKLNPGVWEIAPLPSRHGTPRSLVTQIMEIKPTGWGLLRKIFHCKFQKTIPYFLLCRTAGLRELFSASSETSIMEELPLVPFSKEVGMGLPPTQEEPEGPETNEQFYDAIAAEEPAGEDDSEEEEELQQALMVSNKKKSVSWSARLGLPSKRPPCREENGELMLNVQPVGIDSSLFNCSLRQGSVDDNTDCWTDPGGKGFMVRGRTYLQDFIKVPGGDPLFKLLGVDWLKSDKKIDMVARHPNCLVKSAEAKKLPFIFIVNLQIPAKPNYSLIFYFGADRPIRPNSLLHKFTTGDDNFRNARLKMIPRIVEGYWVIKRAVGTKACLLGRALTCKYFKEDNFLEIDVDVGSSSVARSVCGLVLGYATSVVIDFAIFIEAREQNELPEYLLGVSRINQIKPESALSYQEM